MPLIVEHIAAQQRIDGERGVETGAQGRRVGLDVGNAGKPRQLLGKDKTRQVPILAWSDALGRARLA